MLFAPSLGRYAATPVEKRVTSPERERIEKLIARMEASVRAAFLRFVANVQSPEAMREVSELLGRGNIEAALAVVDRYVGRMAPIVSAVFQAAAIDEAGALAMQASRWAPAIGFSFDPTNERAARIMRENQLEFVVQFGESQRAAVRQAITNAMMEGDGPEKTARAFRDSIGLTDFQEQAVRNYRRYLETGNREALERELRDRRSDPSVKRALRTDEPLSPRQIESMTERYRKNYVAYRADTIAATEGGRVTGAGRQEAFDQIADELGLDDNQVERDWFTHRDGRERWSHRNMKVRTVRGRKAPFITGAGVPMMRPHAPGAPAAEVIHCRCFQNFRIRKPE